MKTYVETLSSSDEDEEVVEVPFVKPKPPVIVLSCSEEEDDEVSAVSTEADVRIINGSQPSSSEGRGQTDSPHSARKSKRKEPEKDKLGRSKSKSGRACEGSSRNVEPGSVRSSENASEPPGSDEPEPALPVIRISSNIFDPSHTALVDNTDPAPVAAPAVPRFVVNPVGPGARTRATNKIVPPPDAQPPKKRAPTTRTRAVSDPTHAPASTNTAQASESSFVCFLRSINLPVPDEFLEPHNPKRKAGGGGKRKTGRSMEWRLTSSLYDGIQNIPHSYSPHTPKTITGLIVDNIPVNRDFGTSNLALVGKVSFGCSETGYGWLLRWLLTWRLCQMFQTAPFELSRNPESRLRPPWYNFLQNSSILHILEFEGLSIKHETLWFHYNHDLIPRYLHKSKSMISLASSRPYLDNASRLSPPSPSLLHDNYFLGKIIRIC